MTNLSFGGIKAPKLIESSIPDIAPVATRDPSDDIVPPSAFHFARLPDQNKQILMR